MGGPFLFIDKGYMKVCTWEECCVLRWRDESLCKLLDDAFGQLYFSLKLVTMKVITVDEGVAWCLL